MSTYFVTSMILGGMSGAVSAVNDFLYEMLNGLAGRSRIFDELIGLSEKTVFPEAVVLTACFLFAWNYSGRDGSINRNRAILLVTVLSALLTVAAINKISAAVFLPRPSIQSRPTFHLDDGQLVAGKRLSYRGLQTKEGQAFSNALEKGSITRDDLGSFPSRPAGLFLTLAIGIFLVHRRAGLICFFWMLLLPLGGRVIAGQQSPLGIAAGACIGVVILLILQFAFGRYGRNLTDRAVGWTFRHPSMTNVLIFLFIFDAVQMFGNTQLILNVGTGIAGHLLRG